MKRMKPNKGFTLIEILLVVVIIGIMLAVIVPRAWRANIDSKYGLCRQNGSELASFASLWAEQNILSHDEISEARIMDYYASLTGVSSVADVTDFNESAWVAESEESNWNTSSAGANFIDVDGRSMDGDNDQPPSMKVEDVVPPEKIPRNPFNGVSIFATPNLPGDTAPVTGAMACAGINEDNEQWIYFALLFQGTDSTTGDVTDAEAFHAGMGPDSLPGLRNGVFLARLN